MQLMSVPNDCEGVRADAVLHRFDQRECDSGGEGRVDRAPTSGEHRQAGLRGERL